MPVTLTVNGHRIAATAGLSLFAAAEQAGVRVPTRKGEGLIRRLDVSLDPIVMLDAALQEAAKAAGVELTVENGAILITPLP